MFLTYLSTACLYFVIMGVGPFLLAADLDSGVKIVLACMFALCNIVGRKMKLTSVYPLNRIIGLTGWIDP